MLRIAVVDDDPSDQEVAIRFAQRYFSQQSIEIHSSRFADGLSFLEGYRPIYDIIFLDIEMPGIDGMKCARQLRLKDKTTPIVFETNMAQYAAMGYDVDAIGYLVKPLRFSSFVLAMRRAQKFLHRFQDVVLWIATKNGNVAVPSGELLYVEVRKHELSYHTASGTLMSWGSLKECSHQLAQARFFQCNRYCLVNLEHVRGLSGDEARMDTGEILQVSRRNKKGMLEALNDYYGSR